MGVSNLRQSSRLSDNGDELLQSLNSERLSVESIDHKIAEGLCEGYPYQGQTIYFGHLIYDEESEFGRARDIEVNYQYRSDSGLFIIKSEVDLPLRDIINNINSSDETQFRVYHNLSPERESLWEFISNSDRVIDISFIQKSGDEVETGKLTGESLSEYAREYPIEAATAVYSFDDQQILVRYTGESLRIDSPSPEANEFIIQLFERDVLPNSNI